MTTQVDTGTDELLCALDGHVATLTLNRPDKRKASFMEKRQPNFTGD
jgi:hypothetical protein